ncbi:hypothetical protein Tco_0376680, partial [Tanacetum coccineum]
KGLQSRLDFGNTPKKARRIRSDSLSPGDRNSPARYYYKREKSKMEARRKDEDMSVFNRLSHRKRSAFERLIEIVLQTRAAPEPEATSAVSESLMAIPTPPKGLGLEIAPAVMTTTGA